MNLHLFSNVQRKTLLFYESYPHEIVGRLMQMDHNRSKENVFFSKFRRKTLSNVGPVFVKILTEPNVHPKHLNVSFKRLLNLYVTFHLNLGLLPLQLKQIKLFW